MWRHLTLLRGNQALTDDQATLSKLGFAGSVNLSVVFATRTVTEVVLVTAASVETGIRGAKHGALAWVAPTAAASSRWGASVTVFQSSTRLPVTWEG